MLIIDVFYACCVSVLRVTGVQTKRSHGVAWTMPCNEVDVERQELSSRKCKDIVTIVLKLVSTTQVRVARIRVYSIFYCVFDWTGDV